MKNYSKNVLLIFLSTLACVSMTQATITSNNKPRISIIFIIDGFSTRTFEKVRPFLTGGIKTLADKGIFYENAYHEHFRPQTTEGYLALTSGSTPRIHGGVDNNWLQNDLPGQPLTSPVDLPTDAFVFNPVTGLPTTTVRGPNLIMAPTISDLLVMNAPAGKKNIAYCIGGSTFTAIFQAGRLGKFVASTGVSGKAGGFTTSKYYFDAIPDIVNQFNQNVVFPITGPVSWPLFFGNPNNPAYEGVNRLTYAPCAKLQQVPGPGIAGTNNIPLNNFFRTPAQNALIFDLSVLILAQQLADPTVHDIILWVNPTNTDNNGHAWGPDSYEHIDLIYYLDNQIQKFMNQVFALPGINKRDILFALSADHGFSPSPELLYASQPCDPLCTPDCTIGCATPPGFNLAARVNLNQGPTSLLAQINAYVASRYNYPAGNPPPFQGPVTNILAPQAFSVVNGNPSSIYFDIAKLNAFSSDPAVQEALIQDVKTNVVDKFPNVADKFPLVTFSWTLRELENRKLDDTVIKNNPNEISAHAKNFIYPHRNGQITFSMQPFADPFVPACPTVGGAGHSYYGEDNNHVPLMIWQPCVLQNQVITEKVATEQLPHTIAQAMQFERPSSREFEPLPLAKNVQQKKKTVKKISQIGLIMKRK